MDVQTLGLRRFLLETKWLKKMYSSTITYKDDHFAKKWIKID